MCVCVDTCAYILREMSRRETIVSWVGVCLILLGITDVFSNVVEPYYTPMSNNENSGHSTSLTIVGTVSCLKLAILVGV